MSKRHLNIKEITEILDLTIEDITMEKLRDFFAVRYGQDNPRFNTFDTFKLPKGKLYNREDVETTVGRYIINLVVFPRKFLMKHGYQNIVLDSKNIAAIEKQLADMLLNDEMNSDDYIHYLDKGEWFSLGTAYFIVPTMNYGINTPIPEVIKRRDELFNEYRKEIEAGDPNVADKIESELLAMAKGILKERGEESYGFFDSGEFSFANNYKKTSIMAGSIENPHTKKLNILKSNYVNGISKEDFNHFANLTVIGGFSRGVETQIAGYSTKKINSAMQTAVLQEAGTDCGAKNYLETTINSNMKNMFLYRWVLDGGKLVMLDNSNISRFVDKPVKLRSPLYCESEQICNKCAGEMFYKIGFKNAGLLTSTLSGSMMNLALKKFHDTTIRFTKVDVNKFITKR